MVAAAVDAVGNFSPLTWFATTALGIAACLALVLLGAAIEVVREIGRARHRPALQPWPPARPRE